MQRSEITFTPPSEYFDGSTSAEHDVVMAFLETAHGAIKRDYGIKTAQLLVDERYAGQRQEANDGGSAVARVRGVRVLHWLTPVSLAKEHND